MRGAGVNYALKSKEVEDVLDREMEV
jgi:hypothetical protein